MYSELIFGKQLSDITLIDLQDFFLEEREETSILEFKSGGVSVDDIYKEVCAFLNTEGGVLVIGTPREQKKKLGSKTEVTVCQGDLVPSPFRGKDWLMTSIVSNISPPPTSIKIQEIHSGKGTHFIVEVPQSMTPPHQSNGDGRYYIRMERDARPAPHGLVEALFFKRQKPALEIDISIEEISQRIYAFTVTLINDSLFPAEKPEFIINIQNVKFLYKGNVSERNKIVSHSNLDNYFSTNVSIDGVLWKGITCSNTFHIELNSSLPPEPFSFYITAWSRNVGVKHWADVFDPVKEEFIFDEHPDNMSEIEIKAYHEKIFKYIQDKKVIE